mmetsp:Transcript_15771/g.27183  ORF Transcript_15771/g.27183 Transcript_15771/m.27183 type:complete len:250 (-) Transcript_15771:850-1599(-)
MFLSFWTLVQSTIRVRNSTWTSRTDNNNVGLRLRSGMLLRFRLLLRLGLHDLNFSNSTLGSRNRILRTEKRQQGGQTVPIPTVDGPVEPLALVVATHTDADGVLHEDQCNRRDRDRDSNGGTNCGQLVAEEHALGYAAVGRIEHALARLGRYERVDGHIGPAPCHNGTGDTSHAMAAEHIEGVVELELALDPQGRVRADDPEGADADRRHAGDVTARWRDRYQPDNGANAGPSRRRMTLKDPLENHPGQ